LIPNILNDILNLLKWTNLDWDTF